MAMTPRPTLRRMPCSSQPRTASSCISPLHRPPRHRRHAMASSPSSPPEFHLLLPLLTSLLIFLLFSPCHLYRRCGNHQICVQAAVSTGRGPARAEAARIFIKLLEVFPKRLQCQFQKLAGLRSYVVTASSGLFLANEGHGCVQDPNHIFDNPQPLDPRSHVHNVERIDNTLGRRTERWAKASDDEGVTESTGCRVAAGGEVARNGVVSQQLGVEGGGHCVAAGNEPLRKGTVSLPVARHRLRVPVRHHAFS